MVSNAPLSNSMCMFLYTCTQLYAYTHRACNVASSSRQRNSICLSLYQHTRAHVSHAITDSLAPTTAYVHVHVASIAVSTICIRLMLSPLGVMVARNAGRMQLMQPELKELTEKFQALKARCVHLPGCMIIRICTCNMSCHRVCMAICRVICV